MTELNIPSKKHSIVMNFKGRSPDEISLKSGDKVALLDVPAKSDDRVYVVKFSGDQSEECRGWIPRYVLASLTQKPPGRYWVPR